MVQKKPKPRPRELFSGILGANLNQTISYYPGLK